jgi:hypothetical protein
MGAVVEDLLHHQPELRLSSAQLPVRCYLPTDSDAGVVGAVAVAVAEVEAIAEERARKVANATFLTEQKRQRLVQQARVHTQEEKRAKEEAQLRAAQREQLATCPAAAVVRWQEEGCDRSDSGRDSALAREAPERLCCSRFNDLTDAAMGTAAVVAAKTECESHIAEHEECMLALNEGE